MLVFFGVIVVFVIYIYLSYNMSSNRDSAKWEVTNIKEIDKVKLDMFPEVCLLIQTANRSTVSRSNRRTTEGLKLYSVYLLSSTHRKKLKVFSSEYKQKSKTELVRISEEYNKSIVRYSPQISEKTRSRRR